MVTYLCYYPHYLGTTAGKMRLDDNLFCLLLAMIKNPEEPVMITRTYGKGKKKTVREEPEDNHLDELFDMIEFGTVENRVLPKIDLELHRQLIQFEDDTVHAFPDMMTGFWEDSGGDPKEDKKARQRPAKILRAFAKQGYIAGEWEEGTHALALPGYEKAAARAMAKLEAKHEEDEVEGYF